MRNSTIIVSSTVVPITVQANAGSWRSLPAVTACTDAVQKSTRLSRWMPRHTRRDSRDRTSEVRVTAASRYMAAIPHATATGFQLDAPGTRRSTTSNVT